MDISLLQTLSTASNSIVFYILSCDLFRYPPHVWDTGYMCGWCGVWGTRVGGVGYVCGWCGVWGTRVGGVGYVCGWCGVWGTHVGGVGYMYIIMCGCCGV